MRRTRNSLVVGLAFGICVASSGGQSLGQDPIKLSPQYYVVKADDTRVRVLEYRLKPGQKETMHTHPAYVVYFFGPAKLRVTYPDGKTSDSSVTEGEVIVRDPLSHSVENVGTTELHALLVELKRDH